jgi:hypothetical protein
MALEVAPEHESHDGFPHPPPLSQKGEGSIGYDGDDACRYTANRCRWERLARLEGRWLIHRVMQRGDEDLTAFYCISERITGVSTQIQP